MQLFGKPLELLILDVDGVILKIVSFLKRDLTAVAIKLGLPVELIEDHIALVESGKTRGKPSLEEGVKELWPTLSHEQAVEFAMEFREQRRNHPWPVIEGSREAIQWFRKQNIPIAICTTNDRKTLDNQLLAASIDPSWFVAFSTWESVYRKPHPKAFDHIFEATSVRRDHAVYVGDWYPDIVVARGGNVPFFAVLSGGIAHDFFVKEGVPENRIIGRLSDLMSLVSPS